MSKETVEAAAGKLRDAQVAFQRRPGIEGYSEYLERHGRWTPTVGEALRKARFIRSGYDVVFYIAGALTGVDKETKQRYVDLSEVISAQPDVKMFGYAPHLHGTDPIKHPNVTPEEVRDIDYLWAGVTADAHFNFLDPVAHGNAIEAGWAEMHAIPSIHLVPEGMTASRLVRGMHNVMATLVYVDFEQDGLAQVQDLLAGMQP